MNDVQSVIPASLTLRSAYNQVTALAAGTFHGDTVHQQPSLLSLMQSAAEELGFALQGKIKTDFNKRLHTHHERGSTSLLEKAREYLEKVPSIEKQQKLHAFIQQLKDDPEQAARQLLNYRDKTAQQDNPFANDPALYFAALTLSKDALQKTTATGEWLDTLDQALQQTMEQDGPIIRAGFNIAHTASQHATATIGDTQDLCGFYCDTVLDYGGLTSTYNKIVEQYGERDFKQSLQFLMRALGADLYAQGSSIERTRLQVIINDMYALKVLGGMLEQCAELVTRMQSYYQQLSTTTGQQLMNQLLELKDKSWLRTEHVLQLAGALQLSATSHAIYFLTEIKELLRLIPEKAYADINQRDKLLYAANDALDKTIMESE